MSFTGSQCIKKRKNARTTREAEASLVVRAFTIIRIKSIDFLFG
jgi:hypothetical protein